LPITLLIDVSNYETHGYRQNTNKWKIDRSQKILTTTRSTILSCLSIFQTLKAERLGRNQRTRRRNETNTEENEDTHIQKREEKKIFFINVNQLIVLRFGWSTTGNCNRRGFQFVSAVCYTIEKKKNARAASH
jgi:hypothetical protein